MSKRPFGSSLPIMGYAFFVATAFLFRRGYQFNSGDHPEHLTQVYQQLDPELYPHDYFVNASNSVFTVRNYYEKLVRFIAETIGLEWGLFILTFCCVAMVAYAMARVAEELFADRWAVLLAPILVLLVFYGSTLGGNHIMYTSFISSTMAKGVSAIALLQFVKNKHLFSGILLGFASLFQPLVGLQLFLILGGIELLFRRNWIATLRFGTPYLAVAAFILIPIFGRQFGATLEYDKELYYDILYRFRNHLHYIPSLFPVKNYIKFFGILGLGLLSYHVVKPRDKKLYLGFVSFGLLGMLVYWLGLEHLGILQIGKAQWFKTTLWMGALSSVMLAGLLGQLLSGFVPLFKFRTPVIVGAVSLGIFGLVAMTNSKYLPASYQDKYMVGNRTHSDLEKMHSWIAENTPKDITVLVSAANSGFACQAKRSMPIHYVAIIHEPFFMLPWYEDFKTIYGVSVNNLEGINARAHAVKLYQTRNYRGNAKRIDYRLDNLKTCQFSDQLGPILHQEGDWVLTEFLPE